MLAYTTFFISSIFPCFPLVFLGGGLSDFR